MFRRSSRLISNFVALGVVVSVLDFVVAGEDELAWKG